MNIFLLLSACLLCKANSTDTSSIYQLQFDDIDSNVIYMAPYAGKEIILYEFSASNPSKEQLISLDSLYKNNDNIAVIAIPVKDFDSVEVSNDSLRKWLQDSLQVSYPVTCISFASKTATIQQHPLLDWVTHLEKNNHFDDNITESGYLFVISDTGILYSIIKEEINVGDSTMQQVLTNELPEH